MQQPVLRIIMAAYLAIWSPIACCCAVKSALGAATGVEIACCLDLAGAAIADEAQNELPPCCRNSQPADCSYDDSESSKNDCQCKGKLVKIAPSETVAKVSIPFSVHEHPAVLAVVTHVMPPLTASIAHRSSAVRMAHGPPAPSLFAQHCLLTT